jgi:hypothetical protein
MTEDQIKAILNKTNREGDRIICIAVPTRAFRIVTDDDVTFRVEQLVRQAGDRWVTLTTSHEVIPWTAYPEAITAMVEANKKFLLEMRKIKVERNKLQRELDATGKLINV